jgi:hypothetical protein
LPVSGAQTTFDPQLLLRALGFVAEAPPAEQSLRKIEIDPQYALR